MDQTSDNPRDELNDRLTELPNDCLSMFLSSMTMKEAARTSILSRRWEHLWKNIPALDFLNAKTMQKIRDDVVLGEERCRFARWVNHIMEQYLGTTVHELKITFDLDFGFQSHLDNWVYFAMTKQVKSFELNFTAVPALDGTTRHGRHCTLSLQSEGQISRNLTILSLNSLKVDSQVIECLLQSCPLLKSLCLKNLTSLTSIRVPTTLSLPLQKFDITFCLEMEIIDICAPKLVSLTFLGNPFELYLKNAYSLTTLSFSAFTRDFTTPSYAFDTLSKHFSQLTYLCLKMGRLHREMNRGIKRAPTLTNLKHLELQVYMVEGDDTLIGWTNLINASPVLEKLTIQLETVSEFAPSPYLIDPERCMRPLKCLKTLEIIGFTGWRIDLELPTYVLSNAPILEEVILDYSSAELEDREHILECIPKLESILPSFAKLIQITWI